MISGKSNIHNPNKLSIVSIDFEQNEDIPIRFNFDDENLIPTFRISNVPKGTKSLALIMEDTDTSYENHTHWIVYNIDPNLNEFGGEIPFGKTGKNSRTLKNYEGLNPTTGRHMYRFTLYCLKEELNMEENYTSNDLKDLIRMKSFEQANIEAFSEKKGKFSLA